MKKTKKELFVDLLKSHGYKSLNNFCFLNGLTTQNLYTCLTNDRAVAIRQLFLFANILEEPIDVLLDIFYPEDMTLNRKIVENKEV